MSLSRTALLLRIFHSSSIVLSQHGKQCVMPCFGGRKAK
jgi:hypothetical protein